MQRNRDPLLPNTKRWVSILDFGFRIPSSQPAAYTTIHRAIAV